MVDSFNPSIPIYVQIGERIQRQIVRGELKSGDKLLSVREMSIQLSVNPNTVQRTYRELEYKGIVVTKRGQGTFVTDEQLVLDNMRKELQQELISHFVSDMREMGYKDLEIESGLKHYLTKDKTEGLE